MPPLLLAATSALLSFPGTVPGCGPVPLTRHLTPPVEGAVIKGYGLVAHPLLKKVKLHTGIDYTRGDSRVHAVASGFVVFAGTLPDDGVTVIIAHTNGMETLYAHLARAEVGPGLCVDAGKEIGLEGNTGLSTEPHLHFEIRREGSPVDPLPYF
ncbi:MAG: M23 family metallopeptidase [Proteobacteria bacterium]|nr:M23 family metallopeptidase [Pseudomonadota bacterium]